jgi:hypothetical protein
VHSQTSLSLSTKREVIEPAAWIEQLRTHSLPFALLTPKNKKTSNWQALDIGRKNSFYRRKDGPRGSVACSEPPQSNALQTGLQFQEIN